MARTGWRGLVSCLLVLTCLSKLLPGPLIVEAAWLSRQLGDPAAAVAAGTWSDRVPVVLVHGLRGSGPGSWGAPADEGDWPSRIYRSLCREGYTPGRDLFVCDYSNDHLGDYREIARRNLAPVIAHACAVSGWDRVDILARSMGGLVARAYLSSELYRGDVRTLVMLATPHRGSFGAGIVKSIEMIALQEQIRQRGVDHRRVLDRPLLPPEWELLGEFADEVSYVARQSQEVWEPLFGHYYASAWLLAERDGGGRHRPPAFFSWVQELFPGVYQALLARAQRPPVAPSYEIAGSFLPGVPGPGESLSRAYYELLAVQAARHNFFLGMRVTPPEVTAPAPSGGWIERAVAWVARVIQERFGAFVRQKGPGLAAWAMEHVTGLDLKGRAADCLIAETTPISTGGPVLVSPDGGRGVMPAVAVPGNAEPEGADVTANYYLRAWNEWEARQRRSEDSFAATAGDLPPGVRYVTIAGQIPNVWSGLWPGVGPNDLIVETSSTYLQLAQNDIYHLIPSLFTTNHVSIGASGASWRALVSSLKDYYPIRASFAPRYVPGRSRLVSYTRRGTLQAEVYQPAYLELKVPAVGRVGATLEYTIDASGQGSDAGGLSAWAYLELPGYGLYRYPLAFAPAAPGSRQMVATLTIDVPEAESARLLVGARVQTSGDLAQGPPGNTRLQYRYELSYTPLGAPVAGEAVQVPEGPVGTSALVIAPEPARQPEARSDDPSGSPGAQDGVSRAPEPPVIRAVYRNKQPVRMEGEITAPERWEWDFGDGSHWRDDDPSSVSCEVTHVFTKPGTYTVRAVSWASDGRQLAHWQWELEVSPERVAHPFSFEAGTLDAPEVRLNLDGPLAWVTGRLADYYLSYEIIPRPGTVTVAEVAHLHPGPHFQMVWERPGTFLVNGALTLRLTYFDGTDLRSVTNVYTVEQEVRVYATVVTE